MQMKRKTNQIKSNKKIEVKMDCVKKKYKVVDIRKKTSS
jgi:hypothetical protein